MTCGRRGWRNADVSAQGAGPPREEHGTFSLRSARPNPVAAGVVKILQVCGNALSVGGLDCLDGTPLIDIKPCFAPAGSVPAVVSWHKNEKG
jgi:tRNA (Thr-GGU) A37 N-methylase